jgi:adenylate kinase
MNKALDAVISIEVEEQELVRRLTARWLCRNCGYIYNMITDPPPANNICAHCSSGEVYQREDDKEATVRNRLKVYHNKTTPLIEYYRRNGRLLRIPGAGSAESVFKKLKQTLYDQGL